MWLGRPFEYRTFWAINRLFQSGFQTTIWIPNHLANGHKSTISIPDKSGTQMVIVSYVLLGETTISIPKPGLYYFYRLPSTSTIWTVPRRPTTLAANASTASAGPTSRPNGRTLKPETREELNGAREHHPRPRKCFSLDLRTRFELRLTGLCICLHYLGWISMNESESQGALWWIHRYR